MKIPEFIPFHFDKFNSNLFKRQGAAGVGRWCMIRKAVAEMPQLYIDLNDPSDREGLELDTDSTPQQLTDMLDLAAQRGMIDANLYATGILWIENLETDLGRFYQTGKRNLPKKPPLQGKITISDGHLREKFHEVEATTVESSDKSGQLQGIPTHETKRNETKRDDTHENAREEFSSKISITKEIAEWCEVYGSVGNRYETENAYLEAWQHLQNEGSPPKMAHEMLKAAAAKDRTFCLATQRRRKDPHSWLKKRDWVRDYDQELKEHKEQESQKTTAKGGLQNNGKSNARNYTDAAIEHANRVEAEFGD